MSDRKIVSAIPVGGVTFVAGMEDELAKVLDSKQVAYLSEQGAIEGFSSPKETEKAAAEKEVVTREIMTTDKRRA